MYNRGRGGGGRGGWKEGEIEKKRWGRDVKEGNGGKDREKKGMGGGGDEDGEEGMRVLYFRVWGGGGGRVS